MYSLSNEKYVRYLELNKIIMAMLSNQIATVNLKGLVSERDSMISDLANIDFWNKVKDLRLNEIDINIETPKLDSFMRRDIKVSFEGREFVFADCMDSNVC